MGRNRAIPTDAEYIQMMLDRCIVTKSGCWEWQGVRNWRGYGQKSYRGRPWHTSRLMYALVKGTIPPRQYVCHTCDNPPCINPDHLFVGTMSDNIQDSLRKGRNYHASQTHCLRGHEFTPENTRISKDGKRNCRECQRIRARFKRGLVGAKRRRSQLTAFLQDSNYEMASNHAACVSG